MSDEPTPIEQDDVSTPSLFDQPPGVDWFLANQVHLANGYQVEQGITLNVGGVLISGTLIGGRVYFQELAEFMRSATKGTPSQEFGDMLGSTHSAFMAMYPERKEDEEYPIQPLTYIHLRDAHTLGSSGYMSGSKGQLWRGKLDAVDGYFFGSLSID